MDTDESMLNSQAITNEAEQLADEWMTDKRKHTAADIKPKYKTAKRDEIRKTLVRKYNEEYILERIKALPLLRERDDSCHDVEEIREITIETEQVYQEWLQSQISKFLFENIARFSSKHEKIRKSIVHRYSCHRSHQNRPTEETISKAWSELKKSGKIEFLSQEETHKALSECVSSTPINHE